jgi:hypothetical protein
VNGHIIAAIIVALVMLGGLYAIARNTAVFLVDALRGHPGKAWYDRPYLFRALAWIFTLFWLFGPYTSLPLNDSQRQILAFALYILTAAAWLWILRISYLDGIPQQQLVRGPSWAKGMGWHGHSLLTYLFQLVAAVGIGVLFNLLGSHQLFGLDPNDPSSKPLFFLVALPFLLLTGLMSLWRVSLLLGSEPHTLGEQVQHLVGGRDAGSPHPTITNTPPEK